MGLPRYEPAPDVCRAIEAIRDALGDELGYIDVERVRCYRSIGARTRALARIHGVERLLLVALGIKPIYVIEVVSEKFYRLGLEDRVKVLIHELLHIPRSFSGGLRPHGRYVNNRRVASLYRRLVEKGGVKIICERVNDASWCTGGTGE
ncbi:putative metallopeptidase [Desulfurococcus mucosus]|uniref:Putative phage metallopeptidase domain-containing protein n=1 Tax=Desulfurococcus mucosus (strain ATCC 35584 / DSM 2162 / JCM 9187 / O7/1) TaxID=765177 RepID=E8R7M3_DESM0|nr:putative metallopeptidase [Desulfurococcus mucosus]ADV64518.1 hypothetical protein Desmu_0199 [Desulfurococcus mucosus DSM 2162]